MNIILFFAMVFWVIWIVGISLGFDLKIKHNWLYIVSGFLAGSFSGITFSDLQTGVFIGFFLALFAVWGGPYMLRKRRNFRE